MKNLKNNKAFTIIELLVVIAILGILVLLAGPRLLGYVEKAKLVQIKHDVKAAEQLLAREYLAKNTSLPDNWVSTNPQNSVNNIYDTRGPVNHDDVEPGNYKLFPKDEIGSKLPGDFHAKDDGKVYYEDKAGSGDSESEDDSYVEHPPLTEDEINDLISQGYIPVASADELQQINNTSDDLKTWGADTDFEIEHVGGLDQKYIQVKDIDLSSYEDWIPVGINPGVPFQGIYNGGNYEISNLNITKDMGVFGYGLFGTIAGAELQNIFLNDVNITDNINRATGSLVGMVWQDLNSPTEISNIHIDNMNIELNEEGSIPAGGLIGHIQGANTNINNININGNVINNADYNTGGLIGEARQDLLNINNVNSNVNVFSSDGTTGGLIGRVHGISHIENVKHKGDVNYTSTGSSGDIVGGIVGQASTYNSSNNESITLKNIEVVGDINAFGSRVTGGVIGNALIELYIDSASFKGDILGGDTTVGGIVGELLGRLGNSLKNVKVEGSISNTSYLDAGGILGRTSYGLIADNVKFTGMVNSLSGNTGGFAGEIYSDSTSNFKDVEINADIEGEGFVGGFVGNSSGISIIEDIAINGNIKGNDYVGGLAGQLSGSYSNSLNNAEINSDIIGNDYVGGLVGGKTGSGDFSINNLTLIGEVKGNEYIGGLFGLNVGDLEGSNNSIDLIIEGQSLVGKASGMSYMQDFYNNVDYKNTTVIGHDDIGLIGNIMKQ